MATSDGMSFWKKWWKKKNKDKKGAAEYEDAPLPTETLFADSDLEKRVRARRNNLSVSRSGRYKAKGKERGQLSEELFAANAELKNSNNEQYAPISHHSKQPHNPPNNANHNGRMSIQNQQMFVPVK